MAWKALIAAGFLFGLFSLYILLSLLMYTIDGDPPPWHWAVILLLVAAAFGAIGYFAISTGWYRVTGRNIRLSASTIQLPRFDLPRVPLTVFLAALCLMFIVTALAVGSFVNKLEFNDFIAASANAILPWDPTRTARKYLILAALVAAGAFALHRSSSRGRSVAALPALMLLFAVPLGGVGYEMRSSYWSYSYWIEKGLDGREEMIADPYLYLGEPEAENSIAIRVRNDIVQVLQLAERSGMGRGAGFWDDLRDLEREVMRRRRTGLALVVIAFGLLGGAAFLVRRERNTAR